MIVPELQRVLVQAASAEEAYASAATGGRGTAAEKLLGRRLRARMHSPARRGWRWRVLPVLALLVLGGGAGALASGLISFGTPAASVPLFAKPDAGLGKIASARLVPISAADPHGGPRWGMRVIKSTRGVGCLQVGRLLDGKLVALGQDGAFDDDGDAHALPPSAGLQRMDCALLDGRGRIFESITFKSEPASAAPGKHCEPPGTYSPGHSSSLPACALADERNLYYGMLGPDARSITYSTTGQTRTVPTVGPEGAYLIVTTGTAHRYSGAAGRRERAGLTGQDVVPVYSPISAIHYSGGTTCHLATATKWIYGTRSCSPSLHEPYGYVKPATATRAQLATPIHTRLVRGAKGRPEIEVSFAAPVTISSLRGEYDLRWHEPGMGRGGYAIEWLEQGAGLRDNLIPQTPNIAAGHVISGTIGSFYAREPLHTGITKGQVLLDYAVGPLMQTAEDTVKLPVGSFEVRVRKQPPGT